MKRISTFPIILGFLFFFSNTTIAQDFEVVGKAKIGTMLEDNSADSVVVRQSDGTLAVRAISSIAELPTDPASGEMLYWNGSAWITVAPGSQEQILSFINGAPLWVTPVGLNTIGPTDVYNPTTGKIWMDRNLGATQVATSSTDYLAYGDLYQWGRASDGHEEITWTSSSTSDGVEQTNETSTLSGMDLPGHDDFILISASPNDWRSPQNDTLWQGVTGINNPCPSGYRLPTEAEWEAERVSWSSTDAAGAFASPLKLPLAGYRNLSDGLLLNTGTYGYCWSSAVFGTSSGSIFFYGPDAATNTNFRAIGLSVRCIKD